MPFLPSLSVPLGTVVTFEYLEDLVIWPILWWSHLGDMAWMQSVTSRLETSRYRDFFQFFESIGLGLESFGLEKSLGIGLKNIWS